MSGLELIFAGMFLCVLSLVVGRNRPALADVIAVAAAFAVVLGIIWELSA